MQKHHWNTPVLFTMDVMHQHLIKPFSSAVWSKQIPIWVVRLTFMGLPGHVEVA